MIRGSYPFPKLLFHGRISLIEALLRVPILFSKAPQGVISFFSSEAVSLASKRRGGGGGGKRPLGGPSVKRGPTLHSEHKARDPRRIVSSAKRHCLPKGGEWGLMHVSCNRAVFALKNGFRFLPVFLFPFSSLLLHIHIRIRIYHMTAVLRAILL